MVKHIDQWKIERASGDQSVVHSYSGATVDKINTIFKDYIVKDQFETVILHVGTNDLVRKDAKVVAKKMDNLITQVKDQVRKVAVSSVVKRYDCCVAARRITDFNNLVKDLCSKHNIKCISNDHIDKPFLDESMLHLNEMGDRKLGRKFCTYLKSKSSGKYSNRPGTTDNHFFRDVYSHRKRDWITYLQYVNQIMKH